MLEHAHGARTTRPPDGSGGKKLDRFDIANETQAEMAVQAITSRDLTVTSVEAKPANAQPIGALHDLDLQQEASRKFGMGARQTMSPRRNGSMRRVTSPICGPTASIWRPRRLATARDAIKTQVWRRLCARISPRMYKNKAKNAQEAHECIRPTDMSRRCRTTLKVTDEDQRKLYDLIWKRTLACQMEAARLERTTVDVGQRRWPGPTARDGSGRAV